MNFGNIGGQLGKIHEAISKPGAAIEKKITDFKDHLKDSKNESPLASAAHFVLNSRPFTEGGKIAKGAFNFIPITLLATGAAHAYQAAKAAASTSGKTRESPLSNDSAKLNQNISRCIYESRRIVENYSKKDLVTMEQNHRNDVVNFYKELTNEPPKNQSDLDDLLKKHHLNGSLLHISDETTMTPSTTSEVTGETDKLTSSGTVKHDTPSVPPKPRISASSQTFHMEMKALKSDISASLETSSNAYKAIMNDFLEQLKQQELSKEKIYEKMADLHEKLTESNESTNIPKGISSNEQVSTILENRGKLDALLSDGGIDIINKKLSATEDDSKREDLENFRTAFEENKPEDRISLKQYLDLHNLNENLDSTIY